MTGTRFRQTMDQACWRFQTSLFIFIQNITPFLLKSADASNILSIRWYRGPLA